MNKEVQSFRKARKFEFILVDPTGVEVDRHDFYYTGGYGNRLFVVVDGHHHMFGLDGKYKYEIGNEHPRQETLGLKDIDNMEEKLFNGIVDWSRDDIFVIHYQAMSKAHVYFTGENYDNAKKFLQENESRYLKLTNK